MDPLFWQLLLAGELSPQKSRTLAREFGSFSDAAERLLECPALTETERSRMRAASTEALAGTLELGAGLVFADRYPEPLAAAGTAPPALFVWGDWSAVAGTNIAIVGTRGASTYGKAVAAKFAEGLTESGATIVSGGALGIDAAAHKGALACGGRTVAVLAGGMDRLYPPVHAGLFRQIRGSGCLVSQFAAGARPNGYKFLMRNHLVAALSHAVVIVEAPARSGALSTAHAANDLGRQVFVVPANVDNLGFRGSHALIRDGATLVDHPDQVLEALGIAKSARAAPAPETSVLGQKILSVLTGDPLAPEFIADRTGLAASEVLAELTMLEMDGQVVRDAGGFALRP